MGYAEAVIGNGRFFTGDCFDVMRDLPDASVDMILCDLPYGTTQNKWDSVLPLDRLWAEYWRVLRQAGAVVLSAQTPFDKTLGCSQLSALKYEWIWKKEMGTGHLNAKKQPMKFHENILVFYRQQCTTIRSSRPANPTGRSAVAAVAITVVRPPPSQ